MMMMMINNRSFFSKIYNIIYLERESERRCYQSLLKFPVWCQFLLVNCFCWRHLHCTSSFIMTTVAVATAIDNKLKTKHYLLFILFIYYISQRHQLQI